MNGLPRPQMPKPSMVVRLQPIVLGLYFLTGFVGLWGIASMIDGASQNRPDVTWAGAAMLTTAVLVIAASCLKFAREMSARREVLTRFAAELAEHYDVTYVDPLRIPDPVGGQSRTWYEHVSVTRNVDGAQMTLIAAIGVERVAFFGDSATSTEYVPARVA